MFYVQTTTESALILFAFSGLAFQVKVADFQKNIIQVIVIVVASLAVLINVGFILYKQYNTYTKFSRHLKTMVESFACLLSPCRRKKNVLFRKYLRQTIVEKCLILSLNFYY